MLFMLPKIFGIDKLICSMFYLGFKWNDVTHQQTWIS